MRVDARTSLFEASGVDLTRIPGIDTRTALKVISEITVETIAAPDTALSGENGQVSWQVRNLGNSATDLVL